MEYGKKATQRGKFPPTTLTMKLIGCPTCGNHRVNQGAIYKSIPSATKFWCTECKKWFVVEGDGTREVGGYYYSMVGAKLHSTVSDYVRRYKA